MLVVSVLMVAYKPGQLGQQPRGTLNHCIENRKIGYPVFIRSINDRFEAFVSCFADSKKTRKN